MTERSPHSPEIADDPSANAGDGTPTASSAPAAPRHDTTRDVAAAEAAAPSATVPLSAAGLPLAKNWLGIIAFIWAGQAASMITSFAAGYAVG